MEDVAPLYMQKGFMRAACSQEDRGAGQHRQVEPKHRQRGCTSCGRKKGRKEENVCVCVCVCGACVRACVRACVHGEAAVADDGLHGATPGVSSRVHPRLRRGGAIPLPLLTSPWAIAPHPTLKPGVYKYTLLAPCPPTSMPLLTAALAISSYSVPWDQSFMVKTQGSLGGGGHLMG